MHGDNCVVCGSLVGWSVGWYVGTNIVVVLGEEEEKAFDLNIGVVNYARSSTLFTVQSLSGSIVVSNLHSFEACKLFNFMEVGVDKDSRLSC